MLCVDACPDADADRKRKVQVQSESTRTVRLQKLQGVQECSSAASSAVVRDAVVVGHFSMDVAY